ncbi:hypothetical protein ACF8C1_15905 [Pseudomonas sp. zjy_9]
MTAKNIERFNEMAGKVLGHLYLNFPAPTSFDAETIGLPMGRKVHFLDSSGQAATIVDTGSVTVEEEFFGHTVRWLRDSGYLTFSGNYISAFASVVLTSKGLEVLNAVPESIKGGPSLGEQLSDATKSGAAELLRSVTSEALALGTKVLSAGMGFPS